MRKTKKYRLAIGLVIGILASQTAGCGQSADISRTSAGSPASAEQITAGPGENENNGAGQVSEAIGRDEQTDANGRITVTAVLGEGGEKTISYEPEDLVSEWEEGAAVLIELTGDGIVAKNVIYPVFALFHAYKCDFIRPRCHFPPLPRSPRCPFRIPCYTRLTLISVP